MKVKKSFLVTQQDVVQVRDHATKFIALRGQLTTLLKTS